MTGPGQAGPDPGAIAELRQQLEQLRADVDLLLDTDEVPAAGPGRWRPICWADLDAEQTRASLHRLTGWVDWLIDRYGLAEQVPACWASHPPLVEELAALHTAWFGAYRHPQAQPADGIYWHDGLERVLGRIRDWDRLGCRTGPHQPDT